MGNVRVENRPKVLHPRNNESTDVAEIVAQRVRPSFEQLCGDLGNVPLAVHKGCSERAGEKSPCATALARFATSRSSASLRSRICSSSPPRLSKAFTTSGSNLSRTYSTASGRIICSCNPLSNLCSSARRKMRTLFAQMLAPRKVFCGQPYTTHPGQRFAERQDSASVRRSALRPETQRDSPHQNPVGSGLARR